MRENIAATVFDALYRIDNDRTSGFFFGQIFECLVSPCHVEYPSFVPVGANELFFGIGPYRKAVFFQVIDS